MNYIALLSRNNHWVYEALSKNVNTERVIQFLDQFSMSLRKQTVVVLDNASIHTAKKLKKCLASWQHRGLYIFYLPQVNKFVAVKLKSDKTLQKS